MANSDDYCEEHFKKTVRQIMKKFHCANNVYEGSR